MITQKTRDIVLSGLDMKEASIKRAKNTNKSPNFTPIYELELRELQKARDEMQTLPISVEKGK